MMDLFASKYAMADGQTLFMSNETKDSLGDKAFKTGTPILDNPEYPANFERFLGKKTSKAVSKWMHESSDASKVKYGDLNQLATNGGTNAIGAVQEFEVVGRAEGQSNSQDVNIYLSHQLERSNGFRSGTADFTDDPNAELGQVLKKSHATQERMHMHGGCMTVYAGVAKDMVRDPIASNSACKIFSSNFFFRSDTSLMILSHASSPAFFLTRSSLLRILLPQPRCTL